MRAHLLLSLLCALAAGCGGAATFLPVAAPQFQPVQFVFAAEGSGWAVDLSADSAASNVDSLILEAELPFTWYSIPGALDVTFDFVEMYARICAEYGTEEASPVCVQVPMTLRVRP